ncbi:MAG: head GIN domain-containing protein [Lutibacter sp.]|uniref:head GIN domain-containing protein n=1 Tax=Lutibacter sp. TaxID=1925666 RepID=UPI00299DEBF1|nr:head GIN domain-containing protein [Lutibacter sp.]MDX1828819.1 head GIN domain-containing protein [Lutibacter sp.]
MKKILYILILIGSISCNSEKAGDCWQTVGEKIQKEFTLDNFTKIVVHDKIELIITEGPTQKVTVETGKNLMPDISVSVVDNQLVLINNNTCNFFRDYGITKVYVTSPNLTEIRNASEQNITSTNTLTYPSLYLRSSGEKRKYLAIGDFNLTIENDKVRIWSNGIATFHIDGTTNNLDISFSDGDTRFEGKNFKAKNINVTQISSNDMLIYPLESLTGSIHSVGNVISYNHPANVDVDVQNVGQLIFK